MKMDDKTKPTEEKETHHDHQDNNNHSNNGGWQIVSYAKKKQNKKNPHANSPIVSGYSQDDGNLPSDPTKNVFETLEKNSEQRRRKIIEARRISNVYDLDDDRKGNGKTWNFGFENGDVKVKRNGGMERKEKKEKKKKKEKKEMKTTNVTVAEAAMKIDAADLANFLAENSASYASQQDIQLMRFADYLGRWFSAVGAAQFPWLNIFKESTLDQFADIPVCHVPESVYRTSVDWINQCSNEALESFVLWALDSILADLTTLKAGSKGPKKTAQPLSAKSQVAMFLAISMTLRQRPEVMINVLPVLRMNSKYHGQNKLPILTWMIVQASQGDLCIGMYLWGHFMLPILGGKPNSNQQTRELILQLVERILSRPNAQKILGNGAVRKGERLIPPSALDLLLHVTFPTASSKFKGTDRFETIYPTLAYVALAGTPRSKSIKQISLQIQDVALKATAEGNPKLSVEADKLLVWCLTQNTECYKQWENVYENNLNTSIGILKKLIQRWQELSPKLASHEALRDTLNNFREKNEEASKVRMDVKSEGLYKEADQCCKVILKKMYWDKYGCTILKLSFVVAMLSTFAYIYGYKEYSRTMEFLFRQN